MWQNVSSGLSEHPSFGRAGEPTVRVRRNPIRCEKDDRDMVRNCVAARRSSGTSTRAADHPSEHHRDIPIAGRCRSSLIRSGADDGAERADPTRSTQFCARNGERAGVPERSATRRLPRPRGSGRGGTPQHRHRTMALHVVATRQSGTSAAAGIAARSRQRRAVLGPFRAKGVNVCGGEPAPVSGVIEGGVTVSPGIRRCR
jgi:hypothetical protein